MREVDFDLNQCAEISPSLNASKSRANRGQTEDKVDKFPDPGNHYIIDNGVETNGSEWQGSVK